MFGLSVQWTAIRVANFRATPDGRSLARPGKAVPLAREGQGT